MRICLILEGSYPYVHGGVSTWADGYIRAFPEHEFVLWTITAHEGDRGHYVYGLPGNVVEMHEVFLDSPLVHAPDASLRCKESYTEEQSDALQQLIACGSPDWHVLIDLFHEATPHAVLMSEAYLGMVIDLCRRMYPHMPFSKMFYTSRSMLLPVMHILAQNVPEADAYHSICTGYGGLMGAMAHMTTGKPLVLTEHGIYSREREEEIIRADWIQSVFKRAWIRFFYMLSRASYENADEITSLYDGARRMQIELGAPEDKCTVIGNGIDYNRFAHIPRKKEDGKTVIGAVMRIAPIKDVRTLIYSFYELTQRVPNVELHILGDTDDEAYGEECRRLVRNLRMTNLFFDGHQDVTKSMRGFDMTVLSSISEGQPLSVLESMASGRPVVATDVGACRELIEGRGDGLGKAGICVPPIDRKSLTDALETLCLDPQLRRHMGKVGRKRAERYYRKQTMIDGYDRIYRRIESLGGGTWQA